MPLGFFIIYEAFSGSPDVTSLKNLITNADLTVLEPTVLLSYLYITCGSATSDEGSLSVPYSNPA